MIAFSPVVEESSRLKCGARMTGCRGTVMMACLHCGVMLCDGHSCSEKVGKFALSGVKYVVCPECAKQAKAIAS